MDLSYILADPSGNTTAFVLSPVDPARYGPVARAVMQALDAEQFVRVHQSYIVQLKYIKSLTRDGLTMNNGLFVPVSQKRYADVKKQFMKYLEIEE